MTRFGDFAPLCGHVPSYALCNIFYRQLQDQSPATLSGLSADRASAPVGVNPECGIPLIHHDGSVGNFASIVVCALSVFLIADLMRRASRRSAAVGRIEFRFFMMVYATSVILKMLTTGSFFQQGSRALVILTAVHAGLIATLFWTLLANALVATQLIEDGTVSSLLIVYTLSILFFVATMYIGLDVGFTFSNALGPSNPPQALHSVPLFVLTSIWPGVAAVGFILIMSYIVISILQEIRPMMYYITATLSFVLALLVWFLLGRFICHHSGSMVDGGFIATLLETFSVWMLYVGWTSITEDSWDDDFYGDGLGGKTLVRDHYR